MLRPDSFFSDGVFLSELEEHALSFKGLVSKRAALPNAWATDIIPSSLITGHVKPGCRFKIALGELQALARRGERVASASQYCR